MEKIKICFIVNSLRKCGPINMLKSLVLSLDKEKYDLNIITLIDENDDTYIINTFPDFVNIIRFNFPKKIVTLLKSNIISKKIDKYNFDLIHIHGAVTSLLCSKSKIKKIVTIHNKLYEDFKESYGIIVGYILNIIYLNTIKKFDKIVCCSESSYRISKKHINSVTFVRNGNLFIEDNHDISKIRIQTRKMLNIPLDSKVYIFIGNYNKNKNVIKMLSYFTKSLNKDEYLITLGNGELYEKCKKFSSQRILQLGYANSILKYLYASDIYTSFSLTEGFSMSIIEALHCGLLLLVSNIDSHIECFELEKDKYIGEYFDTESFERFKYAKEIVSASNRNDSKYIQNKYLSSNSMTEGYERIYNEVFSKS